MLKFSQSEMHEGSLIVLFNESEPLKSENYIFPSSLSLFSKENLAPNLVEFTTDEIPINPEKIIELKSLRDKLDSNEVQEITLLELKIRDQSPELFIRTYKNSLSSSRVELLVEQLRNFGFSIETEESSVFEPLYLEAPVNPRYAYLTIFVSSAFIKSRSHELSTKLRTHFSENRYVDTNIPFFITYTLLSGTSPNT